MNEAHDRATKWDVVAHNDLRRDVGESHGKRRAGRPGLQIAGDFDRVRDIGCPGDRVGGQGEIALATVRLAAAGVYGSSPRAYLIKFGTPAPAGLAVSAPAPMFEGLPKWLARHVCSGVSVDWSSRPKTPRPLVVPT